MRHHVTIKKLGRERNVRNALMKSLAEGLILRGKIKTTETKAKALRPYVEKLVTIAKADTVTARRLISARLGGPKRGEKLFTHIAPKYKDRNGGYTRIVKVAPRISDASPMAFIEFV